MSSHQYARPLNNNAIAEAFLKGVLGLPDTVRTGDQAMKIASAEHLIGEEAFKSTLSHPVSRHPSFKSDEARKMLRDKIFYELINLERLESDEKIELGTGGAMPQGGLPKEEKKAFFLTGLPASGKSSIASKVADHYSAVILDSDYAKRKFPEYQDVYSASLLHDESSRVVFSDEESRNAGEWCVLEYCVTYGYNLVVPKIGHTRESVEKLRDSLIEKGYEVHLTLVSLDRKKATIRALHRFMETKRYVPLSLIFDGYSNDPILTYYRMKSDTRWKSYGKILTDVPLEEPFVYVESSSGNPAELYRR